MYNSVIVLCIMYLPLQIKEIILQDKGTVYTCFWFCFFNLPIGDCDTIFDIFLWEFGELTSS